MVLTLKSVIQRVSVCSPVAASLIRCLFLVSHPRFTGLCQPDTYTRVDFTCDWLLLCLTALCVRLSSVLQEVKDRSTFICPLCDKNCQTQHHLTMHIRQVQQQKSSRKCSAFIGDESQKSECHGRQHVKNMALLMSCQYPSSAVQLKLATCLFLGSSPMNK